MVSIVFSLYVEPTNELVNVGESPKGPPTTLQNLLLQFFTHLEEFPIDFGVHLLCMHVPTREEEKSYAYSSKNGTEIMPTYLVVRSLPLFKE
jgi:hypothetical protein